MSPKGLNNYKLMKSYTGKSITMPPEPKEQNKTKKCRINNNGYCFKHEQDSKLCPQRQEKLDIEKFFKTYDWKGLAEAYNKSQVSLAAEEWRELFTKIRQDTVREIIEKLEGKKKLPDDGNGDEINYGYNHALSDLKHSLQEELKDKNQ